MLLSAQAKSQPAKKLDRDFGFCSQGYACAGRPLQAPNLVVIAGLRIAAAAVAVGVAVAIAVAVAVVEIAVVVAVVVVEAVVVVVVASS